MDAYRKVGSYYIGFECSESRAFEKIKAHAFDLFIGFMFGMITFQIGYLLKS